jgi:Fe-S cluster biogenesis protein NfuA
MNKKIEKIIEKVRPYIQMHGGDVTLVDFEDGIVTLQVTGACTHCSMADLTYNKMLGGLLKEEVPEIKDIVLLKSD